MEQARSQTNFNTMSTGVAFAEHWSGPYRRLGTGPIDMSGTCEDAGIYFSEEMAVFRAILHCGCAYQTVWSKDGISWVRTAPVIPWCNVTYQDGTSEVLRRRERPKWVMDSKGGLVALLNGVEPSVSHDGKTFTMVQQIMR